MGRPVLLYENLLEDAELEASSTAAGYSVDALKTRIPGDRWTSGSDVAQTITAQLAEPMTPTAWAITGHSRLLGTGDLQLISDSFTRADEPFLGAPWTIREAGILSLIGNVATRSEETIPDLITLYTHGSAGLDADGTGWVEVKIRFSDIVALNDGGVVLGWTSGNYIYVTLSANGAITAGTKGLAFFAGGSVTVVADTWYTLRVELRAGELKAYVDGNLEQTWSNVQIDAVVGTSRVVGLFVAQDDPDTCVIDFDDFEAGVLGDGVTPRAIVIVRGGDNGTTWPFEQTFIVDSPGTILKKLVEPAEHDWWQFEFRLDDAHALTLGCLALGRRLDFTESMAQGFDPGSYKVVTHQARSNVGSYLGQTSRYPQHPIALKFGPAGLSTTDFFHLVGTPSLKDYYQSCWFTPRAVWFGWDLEQRPDDTWFCMPPANAQTSAPYITAIRRGLKLDWDALVEDAIS